MPDFADKYALDINGIMDVSKDVSKGTEFDYTIGFTYNDAENKDGLDVVTIPGG